MSDEQRDKEADDVPRDGREVDDAGEKGAVDDLSALADALLQFDPGRRRTTTPRGGSRADTGNSPNGAEDVDVALTAEETVALIGAVTLVMLMPGVSGKPTPKEMVWGLAKLMTALTTAQLKRKGGE